MVATYQEERFRRLSWRNKPSQFVPYVNNLLVTATMTLVAVYTLAVAASLSLGYWAGTKARPQSNLSTTLEGGIENSVEEIGDGSKDSETDEHQAAVGRILPLGEGDDYKLALVVRTGLGMSSGKIAAQCSHATLACYKIAMTVNPKLLRQWDQAGQTKVVLRCTGEEELLVLEARARSLKLCVRSIEDAGKTQIAAGSRTVLGILGSGRLVNQVTGKLRLL